MANLVKRSHPAAQLLLLASYLLLLAACSPSTPPPTATPPPSPTASPVPSSTSPPVSPSTPLPAVTPTPALATPSPGSDWRQALRPAFATDLDGQPNATRYEIDLTVDIDAVTVHGHQRVVYTNTENGPLERLYLRLFPNTPSYGGSMTVTATLLNGQPVEPTAEVDGSALRLPLDPPLKPKDSVDLTLDFTLDLPTTSAQGYKQLGYYDGVLALANAYPIIPVHDDEGWNVELAPTQGDAVYSDVAFYDVRITAPTTMTLAASGTCIVSPSDAETSAWDCVAAPMRDFNAVLKADYRTHSRTVEGVTVNSLFYAGHDEGGERALDYASGAVNLFTARFGPYPFTELDVVETATSAGGIEYPGLVAINSSYYENGGGRMEWVVVHEVSHQWWYSLVGNDQVDEPWLDEALAQYSTLLYFEDRYGASVADDLVEGVFQEPYEELQETGRDKPAGLPVAEYSARDYGPVVYQKGPLYFHELRQEVGDEAFWEILQTYFERNRYGIATPEDWLAAVKAVTGDEYRELYEEWIEGAGE